VDYVVERDLRTLTAQRSCLAAIAKDYDLHDGQTVAYSNKAKTRWRLVERRGNTLLLVYAEVEDTTKFTTFLRIAGMLTEDADQDTVIEINHDIDYTKERILNYRKVHKKTI
jgi:hypothetical protein